MHTEVVVHIHNGILTSYKRNTFESVLVRWMNLEPIIQSEVSQKEKEKYHILTHGRLQSMGSLGVGNDWATSLSLFTVMHWRRRWRPTPVFLPGESQGQGSLVSGVTQSRTWLKWLSSSIFIFVLSLLGFGIREMDSCDLGSHPSFFFFWENI